MDDARLIEILYGVKSYSISVYEAGREIKLLFDKSFSTNGFLIGFVLGVMASVIITLINF